MVLICYAETDTDLHIYICKIDWHCYCGRKRTALPLLKRHLSLRAWPFAKKRGFSLRIHFLSFDLDSFLWRKEVQWFRFPRPIASVYMLALDIFNNWPFLPRKKGNNNSKSDWGRMDFFSTIHRFFSVHFIFIFSTQYQYVPINELIVFRLYPLHFRRNSKLLSFTTNYLPLLLSFSFL